MLAVPCWEFVRLPRIAVGALQPRRFDRRSRPGSRTPALPLGREGDRSACRLRLRVPAGSASLLYGAARDRWRCKQLRPAISWHRDHNGRPATASAKRSRIGFAKAGPRSRRFREPSRNVRFGDASTRRFRDRTGKADRTSPKPAECSTSCSLSARPLQSHAVRACT